MQSNVSPKMRRATFFKRQSPDKPLQLLLCATLLLETSHVRWLLFCAGQGNDCFASRECLTFLLVVSYSWRRDTIVC